MRVVTGGPFGSQAIPSAREYCSRTGLPTARDNSTASIAASSASFMPYDPGPAIHTTRTFSADCRSRPATALRRPYGFWPPIQTVAPSAVTSASAHAGAMQACDWNG